MIVCVVAAQARFSFLIGKGRVSVRRRPGAYFWSVERGAVKWLLQLVVTPVPPDMIHLPTEQALAIHGRSEIDFHIANSRQTLLAETGEWGHFPTGELFGTWCMEAREPTEGMSAATAYAHTLHAGHVIVFVVQGFGSGWTVERLRMKCRRIMLSTFRHGGGFTRESPGRNAS